MKNLGNGLGTIRPSQHRTPVSVAAPTVPSEYLSRQELGIYSSKKELNQSTGADSLSAAYGGPMGYNNRQRPSINNSSLSMPPNASINLNNMSANMNEYSGTDTINRGMAQTYMQFNQQFNQPPALNNSSNNYSSVGYASGPRTNLNNMDYNGTGTIYRRPQIHPGIYERGSILPNGQDANNPNLNSSRNSNNQQMLQQQQQRANTSGNNQNNSSILSNRYEFLGSWYLVSGYRF